MNRTRELASVLVALAIGLLIALAAGEIIVRLAAPQTSLYPRWKFSKDYGAVLYENTTMVHTKPGRFSFSYGINKYGYRGEAVPISNTYERMNIIVLGDSYAFGTGVNDGEEFPAVMQRALEPAYDVINLSVGGHGLTQQIRRFYEFGMLYDPGIVLLQFCANDPSDNVFHKVTELDHGKFVFKETTSTIAWAKKYLSHSFLQKSQLYNFFRSRVFEVTSTRKLVDARIDLGRNARDKVAAAESPEEAFYNELLQAFARDLTKRHIRLIMISVSGQLDGFPSIVRKVNELRNEGALEYVDIVPWFEGVTDYGSPEGHSWGTKAHALLGNKLASVVHPSQ